MIYLSGSKTKVKGRDDMAKKVAEIVTTNVVITNDDVLAIAVSEAELKFKRELGDLRKQVVTKEKEMREARKDLEVEVQNAAKVHFQNNINDVMMALEPLLGKCSFKISDARVSGDKIKGTILLAKPGNSCNSIYHEFKIGFPSGIKDRVAAVERLENSLKVLTERIVELRQKLSNLPTLERQVRARLAERRLSSSASGRSLLAAIRENLENDILALPTS